MTTLSTATIGAVHRATAVALLALSLLLVGMAVTGFHGGFRLLVVTVFCLTAPGWAATAFWRPASAALEWTVTACLSIAVIIVMAMIMLLTSTWYPVQAMVGLAVVTAGTLVYHLLRTDLVDWPTA